jgi:NADPH:quinone reductase-like Zn-dependent oxidoreductase
LINGAGGSIGTYAVQIAKSFGAKVTCVDSARKLDMLRSIGADQVIDYTQEDFTTSGETYDVIIDVVGKSSFSGSVRSLKPNGRYVLGNPTTTRSPVSPKPAVPDHKLWSGTAASAVVIRRLLNGEEFLHSSKEKRGKGWSGRRDSNPRPQRPKRCALPDCATPRHGYDHT